MKVFTPAKSLILPALLAIVFAAVLDAEEKAPTPGEVLERHFRQITAASEWRECAAHELDFRTFHPQGLTMAGDRFYLSSVEVADRAQGRGTGHLFEMDKTGKKLRGITLGEGELYHPGGIDYDFKLIWVPVAAYRPDSAAIVYTVDPETLQSREMFRFADHLGAVSHFPAQKVLVGVNWGSRRFYRWETAFENGQWTVVNPDHPKSQPNGGHYIDYQDTQWVPGTSFMLCAGLRGYAVSGKKQTSLRLGGVDLVNIFELRAEHQAPVPLRPPILPAWTQNPFYAEPTEKGVRFYFVPEDEKSTLHVFEVDN